MRRETEGSSLIGLLVTIAIIAILAVVFYIHNPFGNSFSALGKPDPHDGKHTVIGHALAKGEEPVCIRNLSQIRQSIQINMSDTEKTMPPNLESLKLPSQMLSCPVGHEKYVYDPQTGKVYCPHPGHEKF